MPFSAPAALHTEFAAALAARDVDALVAMYERGAIQVQADGRTTTGKEAFRATFEGLLSGPLPQGGSQRVAAVAGDLALTSTEYTFPSPDGGTTVMRTAEVSRRQPDGTWRVVIDAPYFFTSES